MTPQQTPALSEVVTLHNPWSALCIRNLPGEPTRVGERCPVCEPAGKGQIFKECGTPGCTNKARWISIREVRSWPNVVYRCPECCDRIDATDPAIEARPQTRCHRCLEWNDGDPWYCPKCGKETTLTPHDGGGLADQARWTRP